MWIYTAPKMRHINDTNRKVNINYSYNSDIKCEYRKTVYSSHIAQTQASLHQKKVNEYYKKIAQSHTAVNT